MCLAVPLKIESVDGNTAVCSSSGLTRKVRVDFIENPTAGDYVIVHAGFAIERLPEKQALDDIEAWNEVQNALR